MKPSYHKVSQSAQLSNVPTRQPSTTYVSLETNIETLFESPKPKHKRLKSDQSVGESLLMKHSQTQAHLAEMRQWAKSKQLQELREAPSIYKSSQKLFKAKSQAEMQAIIDLIPKSVKRRLTRPKVDTTRPQDVIPPPDVNCIKEALEKIVPKEVKEEICIGKMSILEKTQYFLKKKSEKIEENEKNKEKSDKNLCTFKPNLVKPEIKVTAHVRAGTTIINQKAKSPKVEKKQTKDKKDKKGHKEQKDKKKVDQALRIPVPGKAKKSGEIKGGEHQIFVSASYSQFSPAKRVYSYQEGADLKKIEKRSKKLSNGTSESSRK